VGDDDGRGVMGERGREDFARMDKGGVYGTDRNFFTVNELVPCVEVEGNKMFFLVLPNVVELGECLLICLNNRSSTLARAFGALGQLECRQQCTGLAGINALH